MSVQPSEQLSQEEPRAGAFGLLANGSSRLWDVAIDESLEREGEWLLELDGKAIYLAFRIHDLAVIRSVIDFLQRGLDTPERHDQRQPPGDDGALTVGTFNGSAVRLLWDDESPARSFLVVGPSATSTMRLTLQREDMEMILHALHQVADGLPERPE